MSVVWMVGCALTALAIVLAAVFTVSEWILHRAGDGEIYPT